MNKLLFLLLFIPLVVFADSAGLSWVAPVERTDGTALTQAELGGFRIYTTDSVQLGEDIPAAARAYSVPVEMMGQSIYMTCFDTDGRESAKTGPHVIPAGKAGPNGPDVTVTFTVQGR